MKLSRKDAEAIGLVKRKAKYGNARCEEDGIRFQSKKERDRYHVLKLQRTAGSLQWFTMQIPFRLPGGIVYRADFLVAWSDGTITIEDVKGVRTKEYQMKKKLFEASYPLRITEL